MEDYCERSLTCSQDILPAIGGIARVISEKYQLSYINGIWKEDLSMGLLWYVGRNTTRAEVPPSYPTAVDKPDAPSWTWISQWGKPIQFCISAWNFSKSFTKTEQLEDSDNDDTETPCNRPIPPLNRLIGFQKTNRSPLSVTGYLIEGIVDLDDINTPPGYSAGLWKRNVYCVTHWGRQTLGALSLDSDPVVEPIPYNITCCLFVIPIGKHFNAPFWLALIPKSPGVYKRVGLGHDLSFRRSAADFKKENLLGNFPRHWQNARKETIKLV
jgi:hypothetical protein